MKFLPVIDYQTFGDEWSEFAMKAAEVTDIIWFRIKGFDAALIYREACRMRRLLPDHRLVLSERADIAEAASFDGVHLGVATIPVDAVRKAFPELLTGYSAHSVEEAVRVDADYCTLSPIFHTDKPYPVNPLGPVDVADCGKDIYALGGVNADNLHLLEGKGYAGFAGIGLLYDINNLPL